MGVGGWKPVTGGDESERACALFALPAFLYDAGLMEKFRVAWKRHCGGEACRSELLLVVSQAMLGRLCANWTYGVRQDESIALEETQFARLEVIRSAARGIILRDMIILVLLLDLDISKVETA